MKSFSWLSLHVSLWLDLQGGDQKSAFDSTFEKTEHYEYDLHKEGHMSLISKYISSQF